MSDWNGYEWVVDAPPVPRREGRVKRLAKATLEAGLITALTFGLIAGTAFAGKGGGGGHKSSGGSGSLALVMVVDSNGDGLPNWNDTVTFSLTTTSDRPYVSVNCYQGTSWVYSASAGFFPDYPWSRNFILAASSWSGGAADCTAKLYTTTDGT